MPIFEYKGLNKSGKNVKGTIDADNIRTAKMRLKKQNVYVVQIADKSKKKRRSGKKAKNISGTVGVGDLALMTRQLATLLKANIPLVDSLQAVSEQVENPTLSEILAEARNNVNEGGAFSKSLSRHKKVFSKIYISMVEAGEMSGTLDVILLRLAEFTESQNELSSKVRSAMMYPAIMMILTIGILAFLFVYIIPQITVIFESQPDLTLPWYSEMIINFSNYLINYWYAIVIASIVLYFIFRAWKNSETGRPQYDAIVLKLPLVGKLVRMLAVSRFTRTLSTLLNGGVAMITSMNIVRSVVNNEVLARAIDKARDNISEGESIAGPLKKSGEFPPIVLHMISIGEKTGDLETMLNQVSDSFDFQVNNTIEGLMSLLSPIMLVVMGGVIGLIAMAVLVPIFELSGLGG
ncbi:MAG: type II secretion system inner membrane protein GspF [Bdellovibrionales bacterium]|nr:type II secretion system inner membrane protein GspF [Bdellovibrionales bacterium]